MNTSDEYIIMQTQSMRHRLREHGIETREEYTTNQHGEIVSVKINIREERLG